MSRYFLHLAYDGTHYSGWQSQPEVTTVQETLGKALSILVKDHKGVTGCGRTDAGVHAENFYAHFESDNPLPPELVYRLNAILPLDIAVYDCFQVSDELHARFSATYREYAYYIHYGKNPFRNYYSTFHPRPLNLEAMNEAARYLLGEQDFSSFARSQTQVKTNYCTVTRAEWTSLPEGAEFRIGANRFLRNMVRAIVGTMMAVGEGEAHPDSLREIIAARDRSQAGKSAYPMGLFLSRINYPAFHGSSFR